METRLHRQLPPPRIHATPVTLYGQFLTSCFWLFYLYTLPFVSLDMCQITVKYNSIMLRSLTLFIIVDAFGAIPYLHTLGLHRHRPVDKKNQLFINYNYTILPFSSCRCEHFNTNVYVSIFKHAYFYRFYSIFNTCTPIWVITPTTTFCVLYSL